LLKPERRGTDARGTMPKPLRRAHTAAAVLLAIVGGTLCAPMAAHAAVQPRLIVGFTSGQSSSSQDATFSRARVHAKGRIGALRAAIVDVPAGSSLAATRRALLARPGVAYVEVDGVAHATGLDEAAAQGVAAQWRPNDIFYSEQWALAKLGAEQAWELSRGTGVTIAIVDTGVDYIHPDLAGRVDLGRDFVDKDDDPMDVQGHGTHVAGSAAGNTDDEFGIAGLAPGARILAVRVLDKDGAGNYSQVADGIVYAAQHHAKVINLSLGGPDQSELLRTAIDYASAHGSIVTCATGNDSAQTVGYPARYDSCVAVGATDEQDAHASFSNGGQGIDISAPGVDILSSTMGGGHESWDGTSMATPYVSGTAALLFGQGLSRRDVLASLTGTATDLGAPGYDKTFGYGRVDAAAAVTAASHLPRALADTTAPTLAGISVQAARRIATFTVKHQWRLKKRTGFRRVGTYASPVSYDDRRVRLKGNTRTTVLLRFRGGIVYQSTRVEVKVRRRIRTLHTVVPVRVDAADDTGVDRVAVLVDGHVQAVDWSAGDGWAIDVPCTRGSHALAVAAFDAADNEGDADASRRIRC
jgi:thermitase